MQDDEHFVRGRACPACNRMSLVQAGDLIRCLKHDCFFYEDDESRALFSGDEEADAWKSSSPALARSPAAPYWSGGGFVALTAA